MKNNDPRQNPQMKDSESKLELANKIARQSKKVVKTYATIEDGLFKGVRWLSSWIDRILFNPRYGKVVSLALAVLLYLTVNYTDTSLSNNIQSVHEIPSVPVTINYNSDMFEISGLPSEAAAYVMGEMSDVQLVRTQKNYSVVADLSGLTEGTYQVKLQPKDFSERVNVKLEPSTALVTIKKKVTTQFDLSYDFINTDKLDNIYILGDPQFEATKVNVRAASDTLDSIAFVKALIDVSGKTADFEQDAVLVAYDQTGTPVKADIIPSTVKVNVKVTSPSKDVPVAVELQGEIPDGKAIEEIIFDHSSVKIYAQQSVLDKLDKVSVQLDATKLTSDTKMYQTITLPTGVRQINPARVNMDIKLGDAVSKTIDNVAINAINNTKRYNVQTKDDQIAVSVTVYGTQANVDKITASDIYVYFDMKDLQPGEQEVTLQVNQDTGTYVKYTLQQASLTVNVTDPSNSAAPDDNDSDGGTN